MRKLSLLLTSGIMLLGVMGLQAQSAWAADPEQDCAGLPADVQGFHFGTIPVTQFSTGEVYGGAALCGTELQGLFIKDIKGAYKEGYIITPGKMGNGASGGGVGVHCANPAGTQGHEDYCQGGDYPNGTYFGSAGVDIQLCLLFGGNYNLGSSCGTNDQTFSDLYVGKSPLNPANNQCDNPGEYIVQCLQSTDWLSLGYGNITVEPCWTDTDCAPYDPKHNRYWMHIFPMKTLSLGPAYYTEIGEPEFNHQGSEPDPRDFQLCEFANVDNPGSKECGTDPANWIQKAPPAGKYGCSPNKEEGSVVKAVGVGSLEGVPTEQCYPYNIKGSRALGHRGAASRR